MESEAEKEYAQFEEKVKRSVYLDNLSPQVNKAVIETAFNQYAHVKSVEFIPNYTEPDYNSGCALVELDNEKQAENIKDVVSSLPFMMMGMPRPVRVRPALPGMFSDRPVKPGREIHLQWLGPSDPDFEVAQKLKELVKKHRAERSFLIQEQLKKEEELHKEQIRTLDGHNKKLEMINAIYGDGSAGYLANRYKVNITEDVGIMSFDS